MLHPDARLQREWKQGIQTNVAFEIRASGLVDCSLCSLVYQPEWYYARAMKEHGWVRGQRLPATGNTVKGTVGYVYRDRHGHQIALQIQGTTNWRGAGEGRYHVSHDYELTFILPEGMSPAALLGAHYRDRRAKPRRPTPLDPLFGD